MSAEGTFVRHGIGMVLVALFGGTFWIGFGLAVLSFFDVGVALDTAAKIAGVGFAGAVVTLAAMTVNMIVGIKEDV